MRGRKLRKAARSADPTGNHAGSVGRRSTIGHPTPTPPHKGEGRVALRLGGAHDPSPGGRTSPTATLSRKGRGRGRAAARKRQAERDSMRAAMSMVAKVEKVSDTA